MKQEVQKKREFVSLEQLKEAYLPQFVQMKREEECQMEAPVRYAVQLAERFLSTVERHLQQAEMQAIGAKRRLSGRKN